MGRKKRKRHRTTVGELNKRLGDGNASERDRERKRERGREKERKKMR